MNRNNEKKKFKINDEYEINNKLTLLSESKTKKINIMKHRHLELYINVV